jgi:hypothetical protein
VVALGDVRANETTSGELTQRTDSVAKIPESCWLWRWVSGQVEETAGVELFAASVQVTQVSSSKAEGLAAIDPWSKVELVDSPK